MVVAIIGAGGTLEEEDVVIKILVTLLPQYGIRVSSIQEVRSLSIGVVTLDALIGKLTAFELSNFDISMPKNEVVFKSSMTLAPARKGKDI